MTFTLGNHILMAKKLTSAGNWKFSQMTDKAGEGSNEDPSRIHHYNKVLTGLQLSDWLPILNLCTLASHFSLRFHHFILITHMYADITQEKYTWLISSNSWSISELKGTICILEKKKISIFLFFLYINIYFTLPYNSKREREKKKK